jgi:non-homologous end joining protein Ku
VRSIPKQQRGPPTPGHLNPRKFEDHYEVVVVRLLRPKQKGKAFKEPKKASQPSKVITLMARRASIGQEKAEAEKAPKRSAKKKPGH